ncbi:MAG: hypothetical protein ACREJN_03635, partial [Nitrospiraceae bacterium]
RAGGSKLVLSEVCAGDAVLESLAAETREAKKKLWADSHPVLPWEWRKRKQGATRGGDLRCYWSRHEE